MGHEILYCYWCSSRILGAELDKGSAVLIGNHACCAACLPKVMAALPEKQRDSLLSALSKDAPKPPGRNTPRGGVEIPSNRTPRSMPALQPGTRPLGPILGVVGAVLAGFALLFLWMGSGGGSDERPPAKPTETSPESRPSAEQAARDAIGKAREAGRAGIDIDLQIRLWEEAVAKAERTSLRDEADRERADAIARRAEVYAQERARLFDNINTLVKEDDFKKALDILTAARSRRGSPDWAPEIDRKIEEVRKAEAASGPYQQSAGADGLICIEAERFHHKEAAAGHAWTPVSAPTGFSGLGAMAALPNKNTGFLTKFEGLSPRMDFRILFLKPGKYWIWVRGNADSGADDSVHIGLDGHEVRTASGFIVPGFKKWGWGNRTMANAVGTLEVGSAGLHTLNVWMREDGAIVDRIVLTLDPKFAPKDPGPPESSR